MDEERREGYGDDRRRVRMNPPPQGNILSNFTEPRLDNKSDSQVV
jgi:hypothetical protein